MKSIKAQVEISGMEELQKLIQEQRVLLKSLDQNIEKIISVQSEINLKINETD